MITFEIENLGKIKRATINLKPLTIFIGENNTNKSWVAYCLYGILSKNLREILADEYISVSMSRSLNNPFKDLVNKVLEKKAIEEDFSKFLKENINLILEDLSYIFVNSSSYLDEKPISSFFSLDNKKFSKTYLKLSLNEKLKHIAIESFKSSGRKIKYRFNEQNFINITKEKNSSILLIEVRKNKDIPEKIIKRDLYKSLLDISLDSLFKRTLVFPSERTGVSILDTTIRHLIFSELTTKGNISKFYENLHSVIKDFIHNINLIKYSKGGNNKYIELAKLMEKILGGKLLFEEEKADYVKFKPVDYIKYDENDDEELPIWTTSSLVKSLAYFYLYLQNLASGKDFIVLDEPEMNLHPKAQAQLIELLTIFVNGVDKKDNNFLILTTHSPYILDHLDNLIFAKEIYKYNTNISEKFFLKTEKSFIDKNMVSAYHFDMEGNVKDIFDKELEKIRKTSFAKVGKKILEIDEFLFDLEEMEG